MTGAIVQARMTSERFPGKVLRPLAGRPLLGHLLDRLRRARSLATVVVATSDAASDDPLAEFCAREGVAVHRGPLDDVAARFLGAADAFGIDPAVRISGDSPFLDPALVERALALYAEGGADLVTNVAPRSFPTGQSVEVIAVGALRAAYADMDAEDREHVTPALYRAPAVRVRNFAWERDRPGLRLTLDTERDAAVLDAIVARMERPPADYGLDEVVALLDEVSR